MKLVLHIDRLVLHGVPAGQREALVASLRSTLASELARPGVALQLAQLGQREALRSRVAPQANAQGLGREAALRIVGGMTQ